MENFLQSIPFSGTIALLPSPLESGGTPDWFAFGRVLDRVAGAGFHAALPACRAERATLKRKERLAFASCAAAQLPPSAQVYYCLDPEGGEQAIDEAIEAKALGVGGFIVDPCPAGRRGVFLFVKRLTEETALPVCPVKTPGRENIPFYAEFAALPGVAAVACPSCDPAEGALLERAFSEYGRSVSGAPGILSANDALWLLGAAPGAGFLSYLPTVFPPETARAARVKSGARADVSSPLFRAAEYFSSSDAAANVKWALHRLGLCMPTVRLPLWEPDASTCAALSALVG